MNKNNVEIKNNVFIKRADYEKYQLVLPYRFLFGRKKQRFIYSELEKMHPCFSDEFCFDSAIKGFSKKGALSDVMVIHKYTLAEYEAKRPLSGSLINKTSGTGFLAESNNNHRFFIAEKMKTLSTVGFIALAFVVLFSAIGCVYKIEHDIKEKTNILTDDLAEASENETVEPAISDESAVLSNSPGISEKFFYEIKAAEGRILSFKWKLEGFEEILEAKVKGVFPEQLTCVNMSSVNYEKEIPVIQISGIQKKIVYAGKHEVIERQGFYQKLREDLIKNSAVIREEKLNPYSICFSCKKNVMQSALSALACCFREFEKQISFVEIRESGEDLYEMTAGELTADIGGINSVLVLEMLAENVNLFGDQKKIFVPAKRSSEKKSDIKKNELVEKSGALKIGEIKSSDGKIISFYKSSEGKILKVSEEKKR